MSEQPRHKEAALARSLGTSPVVEVHGRIKVSAGRVVGIFVGPWDGAEMLRVSEFKIGAGVREGDRLLGTLGGVDVFLLDEDLA